MKKRTMLILAVAIFSLLITSCGGGMSNAAPDSAPPPPPGTTSGAASSAEPAPPAAPAPAPAPAPSAAPEVDYDYATDYALNGAASDYAPPYNGDYTASSEQYLVIDENRARLTDAESTLTFSLKVDTAAYTNVARYIESGSLPPRDAVRTEELINYFRYDGDMVFSGDHPFSLYTEVGPSPFSENRYMAFIRVKAKDIDTGELPASNLTFLIDTSGSMDSHDKLPLLKEAFGLLIENLDEDDRVSIVTYAGSSAVLLDGMPGSNKDAILRAIHNLSAGGSTAGANGIMTAYALAEKNFVKGGNNRVILATDGDFNVGISNTDDLAGLVGEKRGNGVYMSVLGFGTGNIRDDIMETLSKEGNGNYSYINNLSTAKKVLVEEMAANLYAIADDVKAQVEFNPQNVRSYRLIGYENRRLKNEDFDDDTKDAGEIGIGTDVVMMFELELQGAAASTGSRYTTAADDAEPDFANELFFVRIRYKDPGKSTSKLIEDPIFLRNITETPSSDYSFACSVAAFGHLLRNSEYVGAADIESVTALAKNNLGRDDAGYRLEYLMLLKQYEALAR